MVRRIFTSLRYKGKVTTVRKHMPIAVSLFYLNDPVKFPCGREPAYPKKTHNCRQSVDFT